MLISNDTKLITKTIVIKDLKSNHLNGGEEMLRSDYRISRNGRYMLKFCALDVINTYEANMNVLLSNGKTFKNYSTKIILDALIFEETIRLFGYVVEGCQLHISKLLDGITATMTLTINEF